MRTAERPRHYVSSLELALVKPFFRYSATRDAYVLRGIGRKRGPVLKHGAPVAASQAAGNGIHAAH